MYPTLIGHHQGPDLQNFVKWTFAILSYVFCVSANKLLYEMFTKELRKTYDRLESYEEFTKSLWNYS